MPAGTYDYVVIGGGSSGSVVAGRLAASGAQVLVLEAGGTDRRPDVAIMAGVKSAFMKANWFHRPQPDASRDGKVEAWPAGKILGGGGSINSTIFVRGNRADYDGWAKQGCDGWDYESMLPLFKRMESWGGPTGDALRGYGGPIHTNFQGIRHPLNDAFLAAAQEAGHSLNPDYNGAEQDGAAVIQVNQKRGLRSQASLEYLRHVAPKRNITVRIHASVERVLIDGGRATGVEYEHKGERLVARAREEVILSGGTHITPKLLMLSGVGPRTELEQFGIPVVHDSPGVGGNLQEHLAIAQNYRSTVPTLNKPRVRDVVKGAIDFARNGSGPLSVAIWQAVVFHRIHTDSPVPDAMIAFGSFASDKSVAPDGTITFSVEKSDGMQVSTMFLHPRSRGRIRLQSALPSDAHLIEHELMGDPNDVAEMIESLKEARRIMDQPAMAPYVDGFYDSERGIENDGDWQAWLRRFVTYGIHPVGTCKMGVDGDAVVDPELKVNGVDGLRVVDCSVIPSLTTGNTNAPAMVIGERASDLILGR